MIPYLILVGYVAGGWVAFLVAMSKASDPIVVPPKVILWPIYAVIYFIKGCLIELGLVK